MATQTVIGSGNKKNNGGVILYGGNIPSTSKTTAITLRNNIDTAKTNSRLIPANVAHMKKPLSAGVYGKMEAGKYVVRGNCTRLAQSSNSVLNNGASSFFRMPIKFSESARRLNITAWNAVTGAATKGGNAGDSYNFGNIDSGTFIDQAAHPSRSVPGEFVYLVTGATPTYDDYSAITDR